MMLSLMVRESYIGAGSDQRERPNLGFPEPMNCQIISNNATHRIQEKEKLHLSVLRCVLAFRRKQKDTSRDGPTITPSTGKKHR